MIKKVTVTKADLKAFVKNGGTKQAFADEKNISVGSLYRLINSKKKEMTISIRGQRGKTKKTSSAPGAQKKNAVKKTNGSTVGVTFKDNDITKHYCNEIALKASRVWLYPAVAMRFKGFVAQRQISETDQATLLSRLLSEYMDIEEDPTRKIDLQIDQLVLKRARMVRDKAQA